MELRDILDCMRVIVENAATEGPADRVKTYLSMALLCKEIIDLECGYEAEVESLMQSANKIMDIQAEEKELTMVEKSCVDTIEQIRDSDLYGKSKPPKK